MSKMSVVNLQWSLDRTSTDLVSMSLGLLRAASNDNVQALAILACERFGVNLAMSLESRQKLVRLCDRTHTSMTLRILNAQIGYLKGDCAYQFAQTDAGSRFLGLAACLSTADSWEAAVLLHKLIYDTARDKTLVPVEQQLKQILVALDTKIARSGFCHDVLGWAQLVMHDAPENTDEFPRTDMSEENKWTSLPPMDAIGGLIIALSSIGRVGDDDDDYSRVKVDTPVSAAAWYIAFVKWCLGETPRIISHGRPFPSLVPFDVDARVTIEIWSTLDKTQPHSVRVYDHVGDLKSLVEATTSMGWTRGLVPVAAYGKLKLCQRFGRQGSIQYQACLEALPLACSIVRDRFFAWTFDEDDSDTTRIIERLSPEDDVMLGGMFPDDKQILAMIYNYQDSDIVPASAVLRKVSTNSIWNLPEVSVALKKLSKGCKRRPCAHFRMGCPVDSFVRNISQSVADILALSVLQPSDPDGVQVWYGSKPSGTFINAFADTAFEEVDAVQQRINFDTDLGWIFRHVCELLGHGIPNGLQIGSSYHDQTIYPQMVFEQVIRPTEILAIHCVPGSIYHNKIQYQQIKPISYREDRLWNSNYDTDEEEDDDEEDDEDERHRQKIIADSPDPSRPTLAPCDKFSAHQSQWQVSRQDTVLQVALTVPTFPKSPIRDPTFALKAAIGSIFLNCKHDKETPAPIGLNRIHQISPCDTQSPLGKRIAIVQSDKNEQMRFFALASGEPCIVRMDACLECCMNYSILTKLQTVIV